MRKVSVSIAFIIIASPIFVVVTISAGWAKECNQVEINQYLDQLSQTNTPAIEKIIECDQSAILDLIKALDSSNTNVKAYAAYALGNIAKNADMVVPLLVKKLDDPEPIVRWNAAFALGNIGFKDAAATSSLLKVLEIDQDGRTRSAAASALGRVSKGEQPIISALIKALEDSNKEVRNNAAYSLGDFGLKAKESVKPLIEILKDEKQENDVRAGAASTLGKIDRHNQEIVKVLRDALNDQNADIRYKSATSLSNIVQILSDDAKTVKEIDTALEIAKGFIKDLAVPEFEQSRQKVERIIANLSDRKTILQTQEAMQWVELGKQVWLGHALFWLLLILVYPYSPSIQAIFFWNRWMRDILGMWYVTLLLQCIPCLRRKLFAPFRYPLLADAGLDSFNPDLYFPDSKVSFKGSDQIQSLTTAFSRIQGQVILEGASGLGKTMFMRYLLKDSKRIVVYLPATKCTEGVIEAIQKKLHGDEIKDPKFLQSLIYSGAIDICIDGLNEISADTRAKITQFVESHFCGNILITTQPLEWTPPATAKTYRLYPLDPDQIERYLISCQPFLPKNPPIGTVYKEQCRDFLSQMLSNSLSIEERKANQSILSNPMELTLAAWAIAAGKTPDLFHLREQQYEMMAAEYQQLWNREFPLKAFSEAAYQLWLSDKRTLPITEFFNEICCMEDEKFRMVISRQWKDAEGKAKQEWYFRHDKIAEFFIAQTFLGEGDVAKKRLLDHIGDLRFRGVYFLLATLMPEVTAKQFREELILYAAKTKDHNLSDDFVLLFDSRQSSQ